MLSSGSDASDGHTAAVGWARLAVMRGTESFMRRGFGPSADFESEKEAFGRAFSFMSGYRSRDWGNIVPLWNTFTPPW
ncbi:hypothetical protein MPTK1_7g08510 [Marchantia polymorpha subsp. ruderalis]|uniref:Uncharacterized protein n=2 Tax=Marchantia polymorpha TaxID=3197 RepID=A0AAF6BXF6_MARPO|nr:hypothetical protein MARPO_0068s0005 [Marchantia polymorpha]BBN16690.1 hypothetical protein Mp_7g08510 [Marchantia polymorpha subsp. ruderalis]|eukprot:PTQ35773.1 hypothetical protein MARPO_0068s0005 [Marchantia polymorpha]